MDESKEADVLECTIAIASAFVSNNSASAAEMPEILSAVHAALISMGKPPAPAAPEKPVPAVPIKKTITPDGLISLEDGKTRQSLKSHLAKLGMTPDEYRTKWGLPKDYPMTAPAYSAKRSEIAKKFGLGANRRAK